MPTLVIRGRATTIDTDRSVSRALLDYTAETGEATVRVWRPHRQLAVGPRDTREPGFDRAAAIARERGYPVIERSVGGRAVAYTGRTVAFARSVPVEDVRSEMRSRYERTTATVVDALRSIGAEVAPGEPPDAYCPGSHSIQIESGGRDGDDRDPSIDPGSNYGKVAGIAQRVTGEAAIVSGIVTVARADESEIATLLEPVYDALGQSFDPATVGSVAAAGGPDDPDLVARTIESALAGDRSDRTVVTVDQWLAGRSIDRNG